MQLIKTKEFLQSKGSERTRETYWDILRSYDNYCRENSLPVESADSVVSYISSLKLSISTRDLRSACLKSYFHFLEITGHFPVVNLRWRLPKPRPNAARPTNGLGDSEVKRILSEVDETTECGKMHAALLYLFLFTGIRISEFCGLRMTDLKQYDDKLIIEVLGKGEKYRSIPVVGAARERLEAYLLNNKSNMLFDLSQSGVRWIVNKYVKQARITKKISPHSLRATCISNALENGANVVYLQELAGWNSPSMATRYDRRRSEIKNSAAFLVKYK